ncbi:MAG: polysaccharide deacetylase family protein [Fusobacterium necrophorum]|nr:polysaccharide deacetylase family protein [Fusobacterium necrophorum]MDY2573404.1 polysaccharide deacetylase family protein [Fusobacterium necrophorum]
MIKFLKKLWMKEIPILMYHRLVDNDEGKGVHSIYYDVHSFEKQLQYLQKNGFTTITFREYKGLTDIQKKEKKYIILTFDDGYEDNYTLLFPLLQKYQMKAVIYLVSHLTCNQWDVEETNEKEFPLLKKEQILEMHASGLVEFGGHTMHHVKLHLLSPDEQEKEIKGNKIFLEKLLGIELCSFAYPFGYLNQNAKNIVKKLGYDYAVATDSGPFYIQDDLYEIRRIGIFAKTNMAKFKRRISGKHNLKKI